MTDKCWVVLCVAALDMSDLMANADCYMAVLLCFVLTTREYVLHMHLPAPPGCLTIATVVNTQQV